MSFLFERVINLILNGTMYLKWRLICNKSERWTMIEWSGLTIVASERTELHFGVGQPEWLQNASVFLHTI